MALDLDATDRRILTVLQKNGRITNAELSEAVNLSPSACHRRVQRLEEEGFIAPPSEEPAPAPASGAALDLEPTALTEPEVDAPLHVREAMLHQQRADAAITRVGVH